MIVLTFILTLRCQYLPDRQTIEPEICQLYAKYITVLFEKAYFRIASIRIIFRINSFMIFGVRFTEVETFSQ